MMHSQVSDCGAESLDLGNVMHQLLLLSRNNILEVKHGSHIANKSAYIDAFYPVFLSEQKEFVPKSPASFFFPF